jgi:hypothetical protein
MASTLHDYRITDRASFEHATAEPRQIAGLYFYQALDSLVVLAHKVSADLRRRPELYRDLGSPSIAAELAKLNATYGTDTGVPSGKQRAAIYTPIFGGNENDNFPQLRDGLIAAASAYAESSASRGTEMLRANVRTAHRPFKDYLLTLHGDSVRFSKEKVFFELTDKICYPVLRSREVAAVFGIAKLASVEYPYAADAAEDLLMEKISIQLKQVESLGEVTRAGIGSLQRLAIRGAEAIATVIDFDESGVGHVDSDIDLLIGKCYTWGTALASLKARAQATASAQQQSTSPSAQQQSSSSGSVATATAAKKAGMPRW